MLKVCNCKKTVFQSFLSFIFVFFAAVLFFSCSNEHSAESFFDETSTLKFQADKIINETSWTEEIEGDKLSKEISVVPGILKSVKLSPAAVLSAVHDESAQIFPYIEGFALLDSSLLPDEMQKILLDFCKAVSLGENADNYMAKNCLYSLAIFNSDFNKIAQKSFKKTKSGYFSSFLFGEPFIDGTNYQVPVRLCSASAFLDLNVFLLLETPSWKIDQIQIVKWGK